MKLDLERQGEGRTILAVAGGVELELPEDWPQRAELNGELTVDNVGSRFLINGTLRATGQADCARCLDSFRLEWEVPVEIMVLRDVHSDEGSDDSLVLHQKKGVVDLTEPLRECAVLALPPAPICRDDCRGICAQCGADLNQNPCGCVAEDVDPRWEGLPE